MKRRTCFLAILVLCVLAVCSTGAFAYFSTRADNGGERYSAVIADDTVTVATTGELAYYGRDEVFNACLPVSAPGAAASGSSRRSLGLSADLVLNRDVLLTADCNLDLGGHALDLAGHVLTIRHGYAGLLVVGNGTLVDSAGGGKLSLQTPHVAVSTDGLTAGNELIAVETEPTATHERAALADALRLLSADGRVEENADGTWIAPHGAYFFGDLTFLTDWYRSGLAFTYAVESVSGTATVETNGRVRYGSGRAEAVLRVMAGSAVGTVAVHLIPEADTAAWEEAALELFELRLAVLNRATADGAVTYTLNGGLQLPATASPRGTAYRYETTGVLTDLRLTPPAAGGPFSLTVTAGTTARTFRFVAKSHEEMQDEAEEVLNLVFPEGVVVWDDPATESGYTEYDLSALIAAAKEQNAAVTDLAFSLLGNDNGTYVIVSVGGNLWLRVVAGKHPVVASADNDYRAERVFLQAAVQFGTRRIEKELLITYEEGVRDFTEAYGYFHRVLTAASDSLSTFHSFTMPTNYGGRAPYVLYDLMLDGVSFAAYRGGDIEVLLRLPGDVNGDKTFADVSAMAPSAAVPLLASPGAYWEFIFQGSSADWPETDRLFEVSYLYAFSRADDAFTPYATAELRPVTTPLTVLGIYYHDEERPAQDRWTVPDTLFDGLHDHFCLFGCGRGTDGARDPDGNLYANYLATSHLGRDCAWLALFAGTASYYADETTEATANGKPHLEIVNVGADFTDFSFLKFLQGTRWLSVVGFGSAGDALAASVSAMPVLERVTLREDGLTAIDSLQQLPNLVTLDVADNNIRLFSPLVQMTTVTTVYLYNNIVSGFFDRFLYGSTGFSNANYYQTFIAKDPTKVKLYRDNRTTSYSISAQEEQMIRASQQIVYQQTATEAELMTDASVGLQARDAAKIYSQIDLHSLENSMEAIGLTYTTGNFLSGQTFYYGLVAFETGEIIYDGAQVAGLSFQLVWSQAVIQYNAFNISIKNATVTPIFTYTFYVEIVPDNRANR